MSKKSQAVVKVQKNDAFTITKTGNAETFALSTSFQKDALKHGAEVGEFRVKFMQSAEEKMKFSLQLLSAFNEYKRITKNGFPAFVHDHLDATCPKGYGKVGSADRQTLNSHKLFNGLEYLIGKAQEATKKMAEVKALKDAGIDVTDEEAVSEHNKEERAEKRDAFQSAFGRCIVGFERFGVTETTVENLLILMGKHEKDSKDTLNKVGIVLRDAAIKAVFAVRERTTRDVTPTTAAKKK